MRSPSTFASFPDTELEAIYEELVREFVTYQTNVALRAISRFPNVDLAMIYIEQPDGSEHQFLAIDPRQATNPSDPNSIGQNQDPAKLARYRGYIATAYQVANQAVQRVINAVGTDANGVPNSNILVVSDHGFDPFHTAVNANAFLTANGFDTTRVRAVASGPAVNFYINLQGREPNGTVTRMEYLALQQQLFNALQNLHRREPELHERRNSGLRQNLHATGAGRHQRSAVRAANQRIHRTGFRRCLRDDAHRLQLRRRANAGCDSPR
mgnify:CR=1 FL=1